MMILIMFICFSGIAIITENIGAYISAGLLGIALAILDKNEVE